MQAAKNSVNAGKLLVQIKHFGLQLGRVTVQIKRHAEAGMPVPPDVNGHYHALTEILVRAAGLISTYAGHGFFVRWITSSRDNSTFQSLDNELHKCVQVGVLCVCTRLGISTVIMSSDMYAELLLV